MVIGVAVDRPLPRVVLSAFLATAAEGDRLAFEPYQVAYEMPRAEGGRPTAEAAAAVAEGRRRQAALASTALAGVLEGLNSEGFRPAVAALLINRAGWMTDRLEHSLSAPAHPPVAEGLAVRAALRAAFAGAGLDVVEMDEKSLRELATLKLPLTPGRNRLPAERPGRERRSPLAQGAENGLPGSVGCDSRIVSGGGPTIGIARDVC